MSAAINSVVTSIDAPIEGWDAFNSLDNMPPTAAIILDNLIPGAGACQTRKGSQTYVDLGTSLPVETVASFNSSDTLKLLAASGGGMWEIDSTPTASEIPLSGGGTAGTGTFSNDRWQYSNFRKLDESGVLIMCNGVDTTQVYGDVGGTDTLTDIDSTGTTNPAYTGTFIGCVAFKGRMYYWEDNDNSFWYTSAGSYQGVFEQFDLGSQIKRGGKLVLVTTWTTADGTAGTGDNIVFVFSTGETLIYRGDDPGDAAAFELAGRYIIGEPLSIRGSTLYGSDAIIMTKDGYVSLSTVIQEGRTSDVPAFSRLIHAAVTNRTEAGSTLFGWDVELYPADGLFLFNVPTSANDYEQHVMNTVTQKWCRFEGYDVNCITVHDDKMFGGTNGGLVKWLLEGTNDDDEAIVCTALYAFNYLDNPGYNKHLVAAQILSTNVNPNLITIAGYSDFQVPNLADVTVQEPLVESLWDESLWDTFYWSISGTQLTTKGWQNVAAYGYSIALLVRFAKLNETSIWRSTGLRYITAGAQ